MILAAALVFLTDVAAAPQPETPNHEAPQFGKTLYRRYCIHCHGSPGQRFTKYDLPTFKTTVMQGMNLMPGFGNKLNSTQLEQVWGYLKAR